VQIYGGNSFATKKPDPEGARKLLDEIKVRPEETVIVGDSHVDVETGRNAGLWTLGVTYGFAPHTLEPAEPDTLVDTPQEMADIFAGK
jgi:phosphoglycolate phosphatase